MHLKMLFYLLIISMAHNYFAHIINTDHSNKMFFHTYPDINAYYFEDGHSIQLEAFKSFDNQEILQHRNSCKNLKWFSLGDPTLIAVKSNKNKNESLFTFTPEGFYTHIQMLTDKQRKVLAETVNYKNNIDVDSNQFENIILTNLTCDIVLYDNKTKVRLSGEVSTFNKFPLRLNFDYPTETKERELFKKRYSIINNNVLILKCHLAKTEFKKTITLLTDKHLIVSLGNFQFENF